MTSKSHKAWTAFLVLCAIPSGLLYGQTAIVAFRTPQFIVVGADSAETWEGGNLPTHIESVCKIFQDGNLFFTMSGSVLDPGINFSARRIISETPKLKYTVTQRSKIAAEKLKRLVPKVMASMARNDPERYAEIFRKKADIIQVLFFGIENGVLIARSLGFKPQIPRSRKMPVEIKWIICPGVDCPQGIETFFLGESTLMKQYVESGQPVAVSGPEDIARFLIQLEISAEPEKVKPPIDVIRLDSTGARWIYRKPQCPDIR